MGTVGVQVEEFVVGGAPRSALAMKTVFAVLKRICYKRKHQVWMTQISRSCSNAAEEPLQYSGRLGERLPPKCCDRCKSDLNWKLMVQCATCSFRCHLYCFSPPRKQHPAFLIRRQQQTSGSDPDSSPPIWKCESAQAPRLSSM